MITATSPAVEHAMLALLGRHFTERVLARAINVALIHASPDEIRDTKAGRALMAEAWDEGNEAGERDYATALDPDHQCIPNPYREETTDD